MSLGDAINCTPHDIHFYKADKSVKTYPAAADPVRLVSAKITGTMIGGVPVITAPKYIETSGALPESGPIFVSVPVGYYLAAQGRTEVFGPDTGPLGVIRDDDGNIIGCKRFVQYS